MINNKKAVSPIATVVLVIMTVMLCAIALYYFLTLKPAETNISPEVLEMIYVKEAMIKFYLSQGWSLNDAVGEINKDVGEVKTARVDGDRIIIEKIFPIKGKETIVRYEFTR